MNKMVRQFDVFVASVIVLAAVCDAESDFDSSFRTAKIASIVVGSIIGALFVVFIILLCCRICNQRTNQNQGLNPQPVVHYPYPLTTTPGVAPYPQPPTTIYPPVRVGPPPYTDQSGYSVTNYGTVWTPQAAVYPPSKLPASAPPPYS